MKGRARIVAAEHAADARPLLATGPGELCRRRVTREELEGRAEAARILAQARSQAADLLEDARVQAQELARTTAREAEEAARSRVTTEWLAIRHAEQAKLDQDADRIVSVAVVMAERLLGASLEVAPAHIAALARGVLAEFRGARRAVIDAHPTDAQALRDWLPGAGLDLQFVEVRDDEGLARGDLRLHTDLGIIDAKLAPRFERLAAALREALP